MNMSPKPCDEFVGILVVAGIVGGKNDISTVEFDFWNVFRRNEDIARPTVKLPSFIIAPILTKVWNVTKFRVALVLFRLHVNCLFPYKNRFDPFLGEFDDSNCLGWRTAEWFWASQSFL